jgi:hypothetical protein
MNNYWMNQLRRARLGLGKKVLTYVAGTVSPRELERRWRRHSVEMQNELNKEHCERFGWYVTNHEYHYGRA